MKHPTEVVPQDVLLWRDKLRSQKKSAATVAFKRAGRPRGAEAVLSAAAACRERLFFGLYADPDAFPQGAGSPRRSISRCAIGRTAAGHWTM